ncbi:ArsR/SmtB family transcription factor [Labrys neptuniae]
MSDSDPQMQILGEFAELARTLGNAHRLILLEHIAQGERPVERLAELANLSIANASQHLQQLRRSGFVQTRREGKHVLYRLGNGPIQPLLAALRAYAEYNRAEIRALIADSFERRDKLQAISREELATCLREGVVVLLDVRPEDEYALGHLPGAINIPAEQLEQRLGELPADQEIVAYCRGPYCVLSFDATAMLRAHGMRVRRLDGGYPAWSAVGLETKAATTAA